GVVITDLIISLFAAAAENGILVPGQVDKPCGHGRCRICGRGLLPGCGAAGRNPGGIGGTGIPGGGAGAEQNGKTQTGQGDGRRWSGTEFHQDTPPERWKRMAGPAANSITGGCIQKASREEGGKRGACPDGGIRAKRIQRSGSP